MYEARAVQGAIAELPTQFRLVVLLRYFEELSYEDIAAALNCSVGTVASRLNRAHRMLAKTLAPATAAAIRGARVR
jgi:RNA polymerase sigma-70 factor (ECF subfamily)